MNVDFLLSGRAHVYYGLVTALALAFAVLAGWLGKLALVAIVAIQAGIFVDLWVHGYVH